MAIELRSALYLLANAAIGTLLASAAHGAADPQPIAAPCSAHARFALVLHGGAIGALDGRENKDPQVALLVELLRDGRQRLQSGAAALDVAEHVTTALEDSALFNAGRGANANAGGFIELDASIMDGRDMRSGAVASMRHLKNPVAAARLVMERSPPLFMVGDRGEEYVRGLGGKLVEEAYFKNSGRRKQDPPHGTVGAVVLDRCGHLAAATSTGGFGAKIPGRVGDSPIVGAGVYANDAIGAFSSTGVGEYFIRYSVPKDVADRMQYARQPMADAAHAVIVAQLGALNVEAALIGIDRDGAVLMTYSQTGLLRGYTTDTDEPIAAAYEGTMGTARRSTAQ